MDGISNVLAWIDPWLTYLAYCFSHEPFSPVCGAFWERIVIGVVVAGIAAVVIASIKFVSYRRKYAEATRAYEQRNAIDEDAIREHSWAADKAYPASLPEEEIAQRIREGLAEHRRGAREQP